LFLVEHKELIFSVPNSMVFICLCLN